MTDMRMARELKMAEEDVGTRAERDRERRWWRTFVPIVLSGFVAGFAFALADQGETFLAGKIPPLIAVLIAGSYVVTMIWGTWAYKRVADELEMQNNLWGTAVGGSALLLVYPPWWILWRGGLVGEPVHEALFLLLFVTAIGAYLWKKYR
jgi:uncharacterized membrane protein YidH (DUF202 family)